MSVREEIKRGRKRIVVFRQWPDGKQFRRFFPNRTQAKEMDSMIHAAICAGTWREFREGLSRGIAPGAGFTSFVDGVFIPGYAKVANRNWKDTERRCKWLKEFFGSRNLDSITPGDLMAYKKKRQEGGRNNATINRELACLSKICTYALEIGAIRSNPMPKRKAWALKESPVPSRIPTLEEYWQLIDAMPSPEAAALFTLMGECALRLHEATGIRKEMVDRKRRMLTVYHTKDSEPRHVPLSTFALEKLLAVTDYFGTPFLLVNPATGRRFHDVRGVWKKAMTEAKLFGITPESLRTFRGTQWAMDGVDLRTIQVLLGHSDIQTTVKHYARFVPGHAIQSVSAVQSREAKTRLETNWRQAGAVEVEIG